MGTLITLTAKDGHRFGAYEAKPSGKPRGGLVVIQEIFGVNPHIRWVADGYAADGYHVLAPAVFDRAEPNVELGYDKEGVDRGRGLRGKITTDAMLLDIAATVEALKGAGKVGLVGYCMGGSMAWLSAARVPGLVGGHRLLWRHGRGESRRAAEMSGHAPFRRQGCEHPAGRCREGEGGARAEGYPGLHL